MITRVQLRYFKRFEDQIVDLPDHVVLAGPNNSGKSTLLQAIALWDLALRRWKAKRLPNGEQVGGRPKAKQRQRVPITRKDFTALPLQEMNQLWTGTLTALLKSDPGYEKPGEPRVLSISLEGKTDEGPWQLAFEFRYQNTELLYVKPQAEHLDDLPKAAQDLTVVHVPPFSGIGPEETRYDREYQDVLTGQGKPGDILRNLLLDVYKTHPDDWEGLRREIEDIFKIRLQPPAYEGRPYILCQYLPGIPQGKSKGGLPEIDIATAGSGFLQVLTLFGFIYAPGHRAVARRTGRASSCDPAEADLRPAAIAGFETPLPVDYRDAFRSAHRLDQPPAHYFILWRPASAARRGPAESGAGGAQAADRGRSALGRSGTRDSVPRRPIGL